MLRSVTLRSAGTMPRRLNSLAFSCAELISFLKSSNLQRVLTQKQASPRTTGSEGCASMAFMMLLAPPDFMKYPLLFSAFLQETLTSARRAPVMVADERREERRVLTRSKATKESLSSRLSLVRTLSAFTVAISTASASSPGGDTPRRFISVYMAALVTSNERYTEPFAEVGEHRSVMVLREDTIEEAGTGQEGRDTVPSLWTHESRRAVHSRKSARSARASSVGTERSRLSRVTPCDLNCLIASSTASPGPISKSSMFSFTTSSKASWDTRAGKRPDIRAFKFYEKFLLSSK
mmetsp:Transcript_7304/g.14428  ORF Transcript_7304/g.14428 Transcript_7304/m.14428 type:complete len:293 (-) Transcript_7304:8-886(-)